MKILHIISGLEDGGAEGVLYRLCKHDTKNTHIVISLTGAGKYRSLLENEDIEVLMLKLKFGISGFLPSIKLGRLIAKARPDVVQTWMYPRFDRWCDCEVCWCGQNYLECSALVPLDKIQAWTILIAKLREVNSLGAN